MRDHKITGRQANASTIVVHSLAVKTSAFCRGRQSIAPEACSFNVAGSSRWPTRHHRGAFTLAELLVSVGVLVLLVLLATQLLNNAATITSLGHKQMDADSQARQLLDRMAIDIAQMVKRPDVDYFLKSTLTGTPDCTTCAPQVGNDQIAFFASNSGYYPTPSYQSPTSLVAYRVNSDSSSSSYNKLERMGKGFIWNGVSSSYTPILFLDSASTPTTTIQNTWCQATISGTPSATCAGTPDPDYELAGPQVFRFEYYYLWKTNGSFSATPWDTSLGHTNVNGMRDVAAIIVDIAVIDSKSKVLLTNPQIATFTTPDAPNFLADYSSSMTPGQLRNQWQSTINGATSLPRPALSGIRLYERFFYLSSPNLGIP
jgi:hypothetical protein